MDSFLFASSSCLRASANWVRMPAVPLRHAMSRSFSRSARRSCHFNIAARRPSKYPATPSTGAAVVAMIHSPIWLYRIQVTPPNPSPTSKIEKNKETPPLGAASLPSRSGTTPGHVTVSFIRLDLVHLAAQKAPKSSTVAQPNAPGNYSRPCESTSQTIRNQSCSLIRASSIAPSHLDWSLLGFRFWFPRFATHLQSLQLSLYKTNVCANETRERW